MTIGGVLKSQIGQGMMILLGIEEADTDEDIDWLCRKIVALRIFDDAEGVMNLPITDVPESGILLVSQFTLMARTKKGNRPSYINAARPEVAIPMYEKFVRQLSALFGKEVLTGELGANRRGGLASAAPVPILIDSKNRQ